MSAPGSWSKTAVSVTFNCVPAAGASIASVTQPVTLFTEGSGQFVNGLARFVTLRDDRGGNPRSRYRGTTEGNPRVNDDDLGMDDGVADNPALTHQEITPCDLHCPLS